MREEQLLERREDSVERKVVHSIQLPDMPARRPSGGSVAWTGCVPACAGRTSKCASVLILPVLRQCGKRGERCSRIALDRRRRGVGCRVFLRCCGEVRVVSRVMSVFSRGCPLERTIARKGRPSTKPTTIRLARKIRPNRSCSAEGSRSGNVTAADRSGRSLAVRPRNHKHRLASSAMTDDS